ncbi:MAG: hypothetical protein R6T96_12395 [Longimicrobiales bacterium]
MEGPEATHRYTPLDYHHHFNSSPGPAADNRLLVALAYGALRVGINSAVPMEELPSGAENDIYTLEFVLGPEAVFNPRGKPWL